ncbi:MAG TPA: efflux RND transporter permease subunit [Steroidobacteraceae bacterium]|nr:efflux RND transporter permease subunit [Steroidobacteraceae bacterium]
MRAIVGFCLRFRWVVLFVALGLALLGLVAVIDAPYDVFPEFGQPTITVATNAAGLAPRQIEALVTTPVEDAVNGIPGLSTLRSQSMEGLSVVTAVFHGSTDVYLDQQLISQRLAPLTPTLPPGATPVIAPLQSSTGVALTIGLTAPKLSRMQLTEIARWTIRPALLAVPGVSKVVIFGARPEQLQVQFDPGRLIALHTGLNQLTAAAGAASAVRGAGVIDTPNQQLFLMSHGQATTPAALAGSLLLRRDHRSVTLGEVAHVVEGSPPPIGSARVGTEPGLVLVIGSQYGANTLAVTRGLDHALAALAPLMKRDGIVVQPNGLRPASFIDAALHDMGNSLAIGGVLILVVLYLALRNWRTAVISFAAIPLSLLAAALILTWLGFSLNTLSLGGLAIALGEVVDDAVVGVENIHRRLRENRGLAQPRGALAVMLAATLEVRKAVIFATFSVALIFLPILHLSGVAGRLFRPLALAYIFAILSSLAVALTVTPALAYILLARAPLDPADPPVLARAKRSYSRMLAFVDRHPRAVFVTVVSLLIGGLASVPALRTSFLPQFNENDLIVHFETAPGTALAATTRVGERAIGIMERLPQVAHVVMHVGRAHLSNGNALTNKAEIDVGLSADGNADSAAAERKILAAVRGAPGVRWWANTFLTERIHETLSGVTAPVVVTIYGRHLAALNRDARRVAAALRQVPGAAGVRIEAPAGTPELSIRLDRVALTRYGFTPAEVLRAIQTSYSGRTVGRVYTAGLSFPIVVVLPPALRSDPEVIGNVPLVSPSGLVVRLAALARIRERSGQSIILHRGAQRVQIVTANVTGSAGQFVSLARRRLANVALAAGNYLRVGGTATASSHARLELLLDFGLALAAILALLVIALRDARTVSLLAVNLPFALVGGIAAIWIARLPVSLGAAVGFVTVFGITLRNAIMLLSHYRTLVLEEGRPWNRETAELGAMHRLGPILMTASVTALGLLPLALRAHVPGQEIEGPMAMVILGGLFSSTALTLLVLPTLALRFARFAPEDVEERAAETRPA